MENKNIKPDCDKEEGTGSDDKIFDASIYNVENAPYISPTPGEFPIIACGCIPESMSPPGPDSFKKLIDCNFNAGLFSSSILGMGIALDGASKIDDFKLILSCIIPKYFKEKINGEDVIIDNTDLLNSWNSFLKDSSANQKYSAEELLKDPYTTVWSLIDEPYYFQIEQVGEIVADALKKYNNKMFFPNFVGWTGDSKYVGTQLYKQAYLSYLEYIQKCMAPPVWSYDLYPIRRIGYNDNNDSWKIQYKEFYEDFEAASRISLLTNRPFWAFCCSMEFADITVDAFLKKLVSPPQGFTNPNCPVSPNNTFELEQGLKDISYHPTATIPYLRFEAFSALAYGAQGILYWNYLLTCPDSELHISALTNQNGQNETQAYYYAQKVNKEIKSFTDVFLGATLLKVRHTEDNLGKSDGFECEVCLLHDPIGPLDDATTDGMGLLISHLTKEGNDYLIVVSHDPLSPQNITLKFNRSWEIENLNPIEEVKNFAVSRTNMQTIYSGSLPAGGYMVFKFTDISY